jgi:hypothetical protein
MGIAHVDEQDRPQPAKWPFDPMQPGDHEPVQRPEDSRQPEPQRKQEQA